jgi:hypothetical protein
MGEKRNTCKVLTGNPKIQRPLVRSQSRWEYNKERGWKDVLDSSISGQEPCWDLTNTIMNLLVL